MQNGFAGAGYSALLLGAMSLTAGAFKRGHHLKVDRRLLAEVASALSRRQMFANHRLAFAAAEMEVQEAKARLHAQNQLAAAQTQVCPPGPTPAPAPFLA